MENSGWVSLLYIFVLFPPLLFLQRYVQREIQSIFLLVTRQPEISMALFSILFLPGILLHETSHFLVARLLGVRTGRFSLVPKKLSNGRLQLGYVETVSTDFVRDSLIGAAPLIAGGILVAYFGVSHLDLDSLWRVLSLGVADSTRAMLKTIYDQPDFWLWFYFTLTISSTMMPSPSDRRGWLPFVSIIVVLLVGILLFGVGPWILSRFGPLIRSALDAITIVFAITVAIHLLLYPPLWATRKIISRISGYQVV